MVYWEHPPKDLSPYQEFDTKAFEGVLSASTFQPDPSNDATKHNMTLPHDIQVVVDKSLPKYYEMYNHRLSL